MSGYPDTWVVVPAYQEETVIHETVSELREHFANVVVVDDGSTDRTAERARSAGAVVVRHPVNLGPGSALQTGLEYVLSFDPAFVATCDADRQHRVEDLVAMRERIALGDVDIVLGSRFLGSTVDMPSGRRLILRLAVVFTNLHTGLRLTDTHNGLRIMTAEAARRLRIRQSGYAHCSEILQQIADMGLRYVEFPVTIRYTNYSLSKSPGFLRTFEILGDLISMRIMK